MVSSLALAAVLFLLMGVFMTVTFAMRAGDACASGSIALVLHEAEHRPARTGRSI